MKEESLNIIVGKRRFARWMTLPPVLILVALVVGPLGFLLYSSFFDWTLTVPTPPKFIWFKNYVEVFKDIRFWNALKNTVLLMILGITTQSILGLILALLLNREFKLKKIAITILALPIMITPVVIGFNWRIIYHEHFGPLNYIIRLLKIGSGASWIADPKLALISIFLVDTWQWTPFVTLILLAGLQSIPRQVYEASNVDGASSWQIFTRVTLPLLRPMFVLVVLFRTIWIFKIFDPVFILTGGGPGTATETLSLYTYINGFKLWRIGYTSTLAVFQLIIMNIVATIFVRKFMRRASK
ncbi:MAG: carbohydrate ABC transporter permease [Brevinematia bacterium]|jgi:multiple sugar transport system permease protein